MAADWTVALRQRLKDAAPVIADAGVNIYWTVRPQGRRPPDIILTAMTGPPGVTYEGDQELRPSRVQFDSWSPDGTQARRMALAIIDAISGPALVDLGAAGKVRFDRAFCDEPEDGGEQLETGYVHRSRFDAMVWHAPA